MKIKEYNNIKHIVINEGVKNEKELYNILEKKVFCGSFYSNTFYPVVINNYIIFAYKNPWNYIHYYMKNKKYRFNSKNQLIYNGLIDSKNYKKLIEQVKKDNKKIF